MVACTPGHPGILKLIYFTTHQDTRYLIFVKQHPPSRVRSRSTPDV